MKLKMVHQNFNVTNLERSMAFYAEAFGLTEVSRIPGPDGAFQIVYLGNDTTPFVLELTELRDHPQAYDLGEGEFHLAFETEDFAAAHALHQKMGCICFENTEMGIYFVEDPDGYWLEVVPAKL
jgi:lactoylglutathione lyase